MLQTRSISGSKKIVRRFWNVTPSRFMGHWVTKHYSPKARTKKLEMHYTAGEELQSTTENCRLFESLNYLTNVYLVQL